MRKILSLKILFSKMGSYQNKMLVLTNCMNVLSSSFTLMQSFLNIILIRKKINQRKILFLLSKNNQFNRKRKRKRNSPKSCARPVQTSSQWDKFEKSIKLPEEWKENFRMSKESLYKLCDELRIYLKKQKTQFRDPISIEKQVACTLYYLADEGRLRKAGNHTQLYPL